MTNINFSHRYHKMPKDLTNTRLLQAFVEYKKNFSNLFLKYDTTTLDNKKFELGKSVKYIILLFGTNINNNFYLWTTIRPWTEEKEKFYRSVQGDRVNIVFKENT